MTIVYQAFIARPDYAMHATNRIFMKLGASKITPFYLLHASIRTLAVRNN